MCLEQSASVTGIVRSIAIPFFRINRRLERAKIIKIPFVRAGQVVHKKRV